PAGFDGAVAVTPRNDHAGSEAAADDGNPVGAGSASPVVPTSNVRIASPPVRPSPSVATTRVDVPGVNARSTGPPRPVCRSVRVPVGESWTSLPALPSPTYRLPAVSYARPSAVSALDVPMLSLTNSVTIPPETL